MIPFSDHELPPLPKELASVYEIVSCLKYTDKSGTYLLHEKPSGSAYLLKTAVPSVYANMLSNEKNLLEEIHQTAETAYSSSFLLHEKPSGSAYLLKTAVPSVYANMLSNEKNLLEEIHQTAETAYSSSFPTPVYLAVHSDVTYYIRSYIPGRTLEELCEISYKKPAIEPSTALGYVISLTHLAVHSDVTYYIRSYIPGRTLEELCEISYKKPAIEPSTALGYVISLTHLLHFMHHMSPPLIHRDIKPQNVVVDTKGGCHFIDFFTLCIT